MDKEQKQGRIEILEPLRGLAALAVAWFHFTQGGGLLKEGWLKASGTYGYMGVEVFFVISGFIIPYSMMKSGYCFPRHFLVFITKRVVRLDPPYLVTIAITLILWYASSITPGFPGQKPNWSLQQLLLHVGYLNTFFDYAWLNPVFWTLAIEFQFYLFAAIVFPLVANHRSVVRVLSLSSLCAIP